VMRTGKLRLVRVGTPAANVKEREPLNGAPDGGYPCELRRHGHSAVARDQNGFDPPGRFRLSGSSPSRGSTTNEVQREQCAKVSASGIRVRNASTSLRQRHREFYVGIG
jgi:hypothetical protein